MELTLDFQLVDAFAEGTFRGNPAGVVLGADALNEVQMQLVAREVNASETAFVSRLNDLHRPMRLRWFTPTTEVDFCGHATLGAAHALWSAGALGDVAPGPQRGLAFETAAGELRLQAETISAPDDTLIWWLEVPQPTLAPETSNPMKSCRLLGLTVDDLDASLPPMRTRDGDAIYIVKEWQTLMEMKPQFTELAAWSAQCGIRGFCVATTHTLSDVINVHSRFFAPAVGINEDPVTGSVHGPLAVFLVAHGLVGGARGRSALMCAQGQPGGRSGLVRALVESTPRGYRASVGGQCFTTVNGTIRVPESSATF